jgi:hypothetical protein
VCFPLFNTPARVGVVHAAPNSDDTKIIYTFEKRDDQSEKTYDFNTGTEGCLKLSDESVRFGAHEPLPTKNFRGHLIDVHDPVAERTFGIRFAGVNQMAIVHILFHEGISTGIVSLQILK